jgi:hypothetical protein
MWPNLFLAKINTCVGTYISIAFAVEKVAQLFAKRLDVIILKITQSGHPIDENSPNLVTLIRTYF